MKPLPPEVSLGQLLDIIKGKKPKPVPRRKFKKPLNEFWVLPAQKAVHFSLSDPKEFQRQWIDYVEAMPRKQLKFLAMVAGIERKRALREKVAQKRARGRAKYQKRMRAALALPTEERR